ncbi:MULTISPECIES: sarcosine oxidase subunit alpha [unclassified Mesorhizobium]|uniref:sarcosine oxidase subunit alpha n=1 Tax=unclassified Mesorhizobium TaxID=325217 RepID=UPI00112AF1B8|nr:MULTISPECIES: sarcosine oxidase subunit alpha [unclassified Mesorhizobium]TPK67181.1 sarcosine oxidase subunit alpha [Mesorhizobium sp. B2-5-1]TPM61777.1 sarcosine oxidase subunit alpha [Mesorhizobium sp. B2-1-9]TPM86150.1 sarcosine oxidase subunit alpha [Mesorhizobium sp. B2-1-4]TPN13354.1 sarcosine oxidase subunit alpha [Mesorhizobium sp. B2-1-2]UCI11046.1 sarcosine oxidase subunit alpha [Mesorhizobium sp. B2-1-1]
MSPRRTETGGRIDWLKTIRFTFDGTPYTGHAGDTLASALLANGVTLYGRSFKYHRPRGLLTAGVEEPNALVTVLKGEVREPNVAATMVELHDGLVAVSQNRFPSLAWDVSAVNQLGGKLLSAGFYYKTFMGPVIGPLKGTRFWMFCEHFIRRAAGLGRAGSTADPARYERMNAFCDVLVVGSGPAGLTAAKAAADQGARVMLAELDPRFGGSANWSNETIDDLPAADWARRTVAQLEGYDNVRLLPRTTVWGYYDSNTLAALERVTDHKETPGKGEPRHRYWAIRARSVVLATGAFERPLVFPGNDRPGVMLAHAAERYANEFGVLAGQTVALFTNNDSAYRCALALKKAGARIAAIVDVRPELSGEMRKLAEETGAEIFPGHAVIATEGGKALSGVKLQRFDMANGTLTGDARSIHADCLLMSGGWSPTIHLASQAGAKAEWNAARQAFLPPKPTQNWIGAGAFTGSFSTAEAMTEGRAAGLAAAGAQATPAALPSVEAVACDPDPAPVFEIRASGKSFVDFQHDVTSEDVRLAHREGFVSVEHLKRYTTLGMATDQGKNSNVPGLAIMAEALGKPIPEVGTTRFRAPFAPVSIGSLAAERFGDLKPERLTPMHDWHVANGATMYSAGLWYRPMIYGLAGETIEQAYVREARATRESAGIVDVSTLGKIAVQGPDAAEFLDRVYTNMFSTLAVGKARYGLMLREDGLAFDDGTTWRLGEQDYLMTTTTANAGKVMQHLEYFLDVVWPELKVHVTSVTDQWAGAAIGGPKARQILAGCVAGTAVDNAALPFMGIVHGQIAGVPVMICRLSFSGEMAFEVYCGADHGTHVWETLVEAGKPFGLATYGLEALGTMRIEKGHVTGAEIDGRTTARDLHLDWMLSKKKPFIGSAMMDREGLISPDRLELVGLVALDNRPLNGGAHIVEELDESNPHGSIGHITACCYSPALGKHIALALVKGGKARHGSRAHVSDPLRNRFGPVEIVSNHFYDPDGSRMHG